MAGDVQVEGLGVLIGLAGVDLSDMASVDESRMCISRWKRGEELVQRLSSIKSTLNHHCEREDARSLGVLLLVHGSVYCMNVHRR